MSASLALAAIGVGAAGLTVGEAHEANAAASYSVNAPTVSRTGVQSDEAIENAKQIASERGRAVRLAETTAEQHEKARERAVKLAAQRKVAEQRAARAAQRKKLLSSAQSNPKGAARALLADFGFSASQWGCLEQLWNGESMWNYKAYNASSGAAGIPQALPGSKMASAGADWRTNPATQIKWGLGYIKNTYGTPCNAWNTWQSRSPHWY